MMNEAKDKKTKKLSIEKKDVVLNVHSIKTTIVSNRQDKNKEKE